MRSAVASACGLLLTMAAGGRAADEAYRGEIQKWREDREARLKADGGWLSVAGLIWLKAGENKFGTGPGSTSCCRRARRRPSPASSCSRATR